MRGRRMNFQSALNNKRIPLTWNLNRGVWATGHLGLSHAFDAMEEADILGSATVFAERWWERLRRSDHPVGTFR